MNEMADKKIIERLKAIFYDNEIHPLGIIRWIIYLLMNGHDQDTYNAYRLQSNKPVSTTQKKEDIGTDIETEVFLGGPYRYNNVMIADYLAHLEKTDPDFFTCLKKECNNVPNDPQDKETFINYAKTISDYSIGRDYMRGGEGSGRRIYDRFKSDCWTWCDQHYRKLYEEGDLDSGRLLTITLCYFIAKLNLLAKQNQDLVSLLEYKETFRKNAGTPKASYIAISDVYTPRQRPSLPSLSLDKSKTNLNELTPEEQKDRITDALGFFMPHLLNRDLFNIYKWQKDLPFISLHDTTLSDKFWTNKEDIESTIAKIVAQLDKLRADSKLRATDRGNLLNVYQLINTHKVFFGKNKAEFTLLFREFMPGDFLTSKELDITITTLRAIKVMVEERINKIDNYYQDTAQRSEKCHKLEVFKIKIEKHIQFHSNERTEFISYQQFADDKFMLLGELITQFIGLSESIIKPKELIDNIINHVASTSTPLELTQYLIKSCAKHLTVDELKSQIMKWCLGKISLENFEAKYIKLCVDDLTPDQLLIILKRICADLIPPEQLHDKLMGLYSSNLSTEYTKTELKMFCSSKIPIDKLEEQIKTHCTKELSLEYAQNCLLKLSEIILVQAELDNRRAYAVSAAINIPKANSDGGNPSKSGSRINGGNSSKPGSRIGVPTLPLPVSPPTTPKGESDKKQIPEQKITPGALSSSSLDHTGASLQPQKNESPTSSVAPLLPLAEVKQTPTPPPSPGSGKTPSASGKSDKAEKEKSASGFFGGIINMFSKSSHDKKKKAASDSDVRRRSDSAEKAKPDNQDPKSTPSGITFS